MGAAYGVPLGGALFALEVMRGKLALRFVLPALFASLIATGVSWVALPNAPTYNIPSFPLSASVMVWAIVSAPVFAFGSILYVRLVRWADKGKPHGWQRFIAPIIVLGLLGMISVRFPEILGNGKDLSQLLLAGQAGLPLLIALLFLKPLATIMCMRSGVPGGLFTPSLTFGALLGATLGHAWSALWPGVPVGFFALLGAGAVLSATTQGPISAVVLIMELTGRDRSFILPLILIAAISTLISRSIEHRSIYDARLSDDQIAQRQRLREQESNEIGVPQ
jgi:CIC family chloride channel protein